MGLISLRISDDLHERVRSTARPASVNSFVREAIAEKIGRAELADEVAKLRERVDRLERQLAALQQRP